MSERNRCARCNAPISTGQSVAGECPACLLELAASAPRGIAPGTWIGPYRVRREIGEGGMGVVYLAEQETPLRRRVALKVIKRGMDSRQVVSRFEVERQALALMDHPTIARVFEAGETDDGRPYFAMEYIAGEPIVEFCDRKRLGTRARLTLFGKVCEGVQHAHRKGIIHRDIKPSNVLVSERDGVATPKIIDFGVAKAVEQRLLERSLFTELGVVLGTPEYMSPEQADLDPTRVDTRSDVYSLGVLLYELLTGALPFDPLELRAAAFDEIRRQIREDVPSFPSTRLQTLGSAAQSASLRRTDVPSLCREIAGDLDAITMKALEKERSRRYESPSELRADIERHLRNEPVIARPPSTFYQLRKWISRHRLPAALGALLLLSLLGFSIGMSVLFTRARAAESRAEREARTQRRVTDFMTRIFEVSDPSEARGNQITARELLDEAAAGLDAELTQDPLVRARLSASMGSVYRNLGLHDAAEPLIRSAVETLVRLEGAGATSTLDAERDLGILLREQGQFDQAEQLLSRNVETLDARYGPEHVETLESRRQLGRVLEDRGRYEEAERILRSILEIQQRGFGADARRTLRTVNDLARVLMFRTRYPEAEELLVRVVDAQTRLSGPDHPRTLSARFDLATLMNKRGRLEQAEQSLVQLVQDHTRLLGPEHPRTVAVMNRLANTYRDRGRHEPAEKMYLEMIEIQRRAGRGDDHIDTLYYVGNLANLYEQTGRLDEAEPLLLDNIERLRRVIGDDHPSTLGALNNLGNVLLNRGKLDRAERVYREALEALLRTVGEQHVITLRTMSNLGLALWGLEREEEAEAMLTRTLEAQRAVLGETNQQVGITGYNLAQMRQILKDLDGARELFERTQHVRDTALGKSHPDSLKNMRKHVDLLREMNETVAADRLARELAARERAAEDAE